MAAVSVTPADSSEWFYHRSWLLGERLASGEAGGGLVRISQSAGMTQQIMRLNPPQRFDSSDRGGEEVTESHGSARRKFCVPRSSLKTSRFGSRAGPPDRTPRRRRHKRITFRATAICLRSRERHLGCCSTLQEGPHRFLFWARPAPRHFRLAGRQRSSLADCCSSISPQRDASFSRLIAF